MKTTNDSAVSPVVGVMLMLVVVIIIAALVSAFAGGLVSTNNKPPQATLQGKYSFSSGILQMYHAGGDELSTQKLIIQLRQNDEDFGGYGSLFKGGKLILNKSRTYNAAGAAWMNSTTGSTTAVAVWKPGETMWNNESIKFESPTDGGPNSKMSAADAVGRSMILEVDTIDGKLISKAKVMIDP